MCQQLLNNMNLELQKLFQFFYTPRLTQTEYDSIKDTAKLRQRIIELFKKHSITSVFDAGCNDCIWMDELLHNIEIKYQGGDISADMVAYVQIAFPDRAVQVHDATTDAFPTADLLFVRDVSIHLNNRDKRLLWQNWLRSDIPWILITHNLESICNNDFEYSDFEHSNEIPGAGVNWELAPWDFPKPIDKIWEYNPDGKSLGLWNRTQFTGII
jgi:SAM-dependent methyltransferase